MASGGYQQLRRLFDSGRNAFIAAILDAVIPDLPPDAAPAKGMTPMSWAILRMASVGRSQSIAARPVVPLPPKASSTVAPGLVCVAMKTAMASGEIFVG
jgi:hypothetical protein